VAYERTILSLRDRFYLFVNTNIVFANGDLLYETGDISSDAFCEPCYYTNNTLTTAAALGFKVCFWKRMFFNLSSGWAYKVYFDSDYKHKNYSAGLNINFGLGYLIKK
jgi:hypothetical protein